MLSRAMLTMTILNGPDGGRVDAFVMERVDVEAGRTGFSGVDDVHHPIQEGGVCT